MFTPALDPAAELAVALLTHYSFDLSGYNAKQLIYHWQKQYPADWLRLAIVEALYQGRYKAISVQQILNMWQRRGQAIYHFNMEFERMICSKFPESLTAQQTLPALPPVGQKNEQKEAANSSANKQTAITSNQQTYSYNYNRPSSGVETKAYREETSASNNTQNYVVTSNYQLKQAVSEKQQGYREITATKETTETREIHEMALAVTSARRQLSYHTLTEELQPSTITAPLVEEISHSAIHPPIEQFSPEKSSDSFTSKLKAIAQEER